MTAGIYAIRHVASGRQYIGSSQNITRRWYLHRSDLRLNRHHSSYLQRIWNKYGAETFEWVILEVVDNLDDLIPREQHYLDTLHPAFNNRPVADRQTGRVVSAETREKLRVAHRGRKPTPEALAAVRAAAQRRRGEKRPETGEKLRKFWDEHPERRAMIPTPKITPEGRERTRKALTGRKRTPEHVEHHRQALRGHKRSQSAIEAQREKMFGRTHTPETREKMSQARAAYWARRHAEQQPE